LLEPLSKFPVISDLIVDRSELFEQLKRAKLWLDDAAFLSEWRHETSYQSARCLMYSICPVELPVEDMLVRSNAIAVWER
jgi:succinate dehydrogenase / fumarate reductase iron-sulfur subunit